MSLRLPLLALLAALLACASLVAALEVEFAATAGMEAGAGAEMEQEMQVDLDAPYFRFQSLDAQSLAEITYPTETAPAALEKILHPQPLLASSLEKVDAPGKEYTEAEARALWERHLHRFARNKHYSRAEYEQRFAIFRKNLVKVSEQNWLHGGGFSANAAFADLTSAEFKRMKGLLFKPQEIIKEECSKLQKGAREEREKAYRDWKAFKDMFGETRTNPYRTPYNETARGRAKIDRWRKLKALKAARAAKKAAEKKAEQERLAKLGGKQAAMREKKHAEAAKKKAATAKRVAKEKAAAAKRKAEVLRKQAARRAEKAAKKAAGKPAAMKKAGKAVKKKTPKAAGKPSSITPKTQMPVAAGGAEPTVVTPIVVKVAGKAPNAAAAAPVAAAEPVAAVAAAPAKSLMELSTDADSFSLDADQLEEQSLAADQLDAEVAALSDLDAETEVLGGLGAEDKAEVDLGVDEELVLLELDAELKAWMGSEAEAEAESEEQASIFARFESRAAEPVEADEYVPPGEQPVQSPSSLLPKDAPEVVRQAQRASSRGAWNFEFPGETPVFQPNAPTEVAPVAPQQAPVAPQQQQQQEQQQPQQQPSQPLVEPAPALQPRQPQNATRNATNAILNPAMDADFKHTDATQKAAKNKNLIDIDWRTKRVLTPPKSQGQCGSCWAKSAVAVVESMISIKTNSTPVALSTQQVVSCDTQDSGCDGGNPITALSYLSNWGLAKEEDYPYSPLMHAEGGPAPLCNTTLVKDSFPYVEKAVVYQKDEVKIAQALMRGPLAALVDASRWQFYDGSKIVYPASGCGSDVGSLDHSVVIVGLGSLPNGERYWIVRNHWDSTWGAGGYIFLAYGQNTCGIALQVTEAQLSEKAFLI